LAWQQSDGFGEVGIFEIGVAQCSSEQNRSMEIGVAQIGVFELGCGQVSAGKIHAIEHRPAKIRRGQARSAEPSLTGSIPAQKFAGACRRRSAGDFSGGLYVLA
jgi:hypothetical protein